MQQSDRWAQRANRGHPHWLYRTINARREAMNRFLSIMTMSLLCAACFDEGSDDAAESAARTNPTPAYAVADFQALRYLEGDWRGTGYAGGPFYESYRFVNDSTIEMTAWSDSTMTAPRERSEYALRSGEIRTGSGGRLARVDENGHHFQSGSSTWTFRQVSPDRWTAQVGPSTTYTMDRIAGRQP